jgi:PhnB protein
MNPHLSFNGNCEEAFRFYAACLGGKVTLLLTYGESPLAAQVPPESHPKILHANFESRGNRLTGADVLAGTYHKPQGFSILLNLADDGDAERIFGALSRDGDVLIPLQQTFWASRFGECVDRFGTPWTINCHATS